MKSIIRRMRKYASVPLLAKSNAGMPQVKGEKTCFDMSCKEFSKGALGLIKAGATLVGGCCGTTPSHIKAVSEKIKGVSVTRAKKRMQPIISSCSQIVSFSSIDSFVTIGEEINPTGKKIFQDELIKGDFHTVRRYAKKQEAGGAKALDVNVGAPGIDEASAMKRVISLLSVTSKLPLVIDTTDPSVAEKALRYYPGRALLNSISGDNDKQKLFFTTAKKYGAMFILLPITGNQIPKNFSDRKKAIQSIYSEAKSYGFTKSDFLIDVLIMTISVDLTYGVEILKTIKWATKTFNGITTGGLSNISFGFPARNILNKTFLMHARASGFHSAIMNVSDKTPIHNVTASRLLLGKDTRGEAFISKYGTFVARKERHLSRKKKNRYEIVYEAVLMGNKEEICALLDIALVDDLKPIDIVNRSMIPAIVKVGEYFDSKRYFLPQLIASAEAMKKGMTYLGPTLKQRVKSGIDKKTVLLATIEGDIHDIGKNIVALLLENYGFTVIDLGKDISVNTLIKAIQKYSPEVVGLSALMTTTMVNMEKVVLKAREKYITCHFIIGGAVVTKKYADSLGVSYARDAIEATKIVRQLTKKK